MIEELLVEDGSTVQPGKVILRIRAGAVGAAAPKPAAQATPAEPAVAAQPPPPPSSPKPVVSQVPVAQVKQAAADLAPSSPPAQQAAAGARQETRVKINRMRQRIAERLKDAQNTYAMLTTFNEVDMR